MADAAAARREARRRRILENSQNRLHQIAGKACEESYKSKLLDKYMSCLCSLHNNFFNNFSASSISPISSEIEVETNVTPDIYTSPIVHNGLHVSESELLSFLSTHHNNDASGDNEIMNEIAEFPSNTSQTQQSTPTPWEKMVLYKYDIVVLSLIIQILNSLSTVTIQNTYFFLPIIVYVIMKLLMYPSQNHSKFAGIFMLMNGISSGQVQKTLFFSQIAITFAEDVCIFLFCTISIQAVWLMLKQNLKT